MNKKLSSGIFLLITILLMVTFSGCIDIHWAKGLLEKDEPPLEYQIVKKWEIFHYFTDLTGATHEDDEPIHIITNTEWMKINVSVTMDQSLGYVRYVEFFLYEPGESKEYLSKRYNTTTLAPDLIEVQNPQKGQWRFYITGTGFTFGDISDSYRVEVTTYEPVRRS